ncbi:type II secretion system F family protein [Roseovarius sp. MMSF_3281]|uniref:type II secretion system F family protein n=1 Tax=Roseovarius sp. MMSF_3281 TaxID=3046694 RepID=UPI00273DB26D|nr:type II secretion system F family protein [Roseovarius sp. MMSF_3281]
MTKVQLIGFILTFAICMSVGLLLLKLLDRARRIRRIRLARYSADHPNASTDVVQQRLQAGQKNDGLRDARAGFSGTLERRLIGAGVPMSARSACTVIALFALFISGGIALAGILPLPFAVLLGPVAGWVLFNIFLDMRRARRVRVFNDALPECLDMFARGLRSGQTITASVGVVAHHSTGIAREEFQRCREELRLGMTLHSTLSSMAERIGSPEVRFIAVATSLQAETGGNLVETLENLAALLRDRHKLRKKAAALSAETRISAVILSGLPFAIAATLLVINPNYLLPLFEDPRGRTLTLVGLLSLGAGIFSMYRLSKIDA